MGSGASGSCSKNRKQSIPKTAGTVPNVASCDDPLPIGKEHGIEVDDAHLSQQFEAAIAPIEVFSLAADLQLDVVHEPEMLWLAEHLYHSELPFGWCRSRDSSGRLFYHCDSTGESRWTHPLDYLYKEASEYERKAIQEGHFHNVDEDVRRISEEEMSEALEWKQLFDERGNAFWWHEAIQEAAEKDPKQAAHRDIHLRYVLITKMKTRLPTLASAEPPKEPPKVHSNEQFVEKGSQCASAMRKKERGGPEAQIICVRFGAIVKKYIELARQRKQKIGPLSGIRVEKISSIGRPGYLKFDVSTPRRRELAATRIQRVYRGTVARRRVDKVRQHHSRICAYAIRIQRNVRKWLRRRRDADHKLKCQQSATIVYASVKVFLARQMIAERLKVQADQARRALKSASALTIQRVARAALAKRELQQLIEEKHARARTCALQQEAKGALSRQAKIVLSRQSLTTAHQIETLNAARAREAWLENMPIYGATMAESLLKPFSRRKLEILSAIASRTRYEAAVEKEEKERISVERLNATIQIQVFARRFLVLNFSNLVKEHSTQLVQLLQNRRAATLTIQTAWRKHVAKKLLTILKEEVCWPLKAWFEFSTDASLAPCVNVRFMSNQNFDVEHYAISKYGPSMQRCQEKVDDMEHEVLMCSGKFDLLGETFQKSSSSSPSKSRPWQRPSKAIKPTKPKRQQLPAIMGKGAIHDPTYRNSTSQAVAPQHGTMEAPIRKTESLGKQASVKTETPGNQSLSISKPQNHIPPCSAQGSSENPLTTNGNIGREVSMRSAVPEEVPKAKPSTKRPGTASSNKARSALKSSTDDLPRRRPRSAQVQDESKQTVCVDVIAEIQRREEPQEEQTYLTAEDAITNMVTDDGLSGIVDRPHQVVDNSLPKSERGVISDRSVPKKHSQLYVEQQVVKAASVARKKRCSSAPSSHARDFFDSMKDTMSLQNPVGAETRQPKARTKAARFHDFIRDSHRQMKHANALHNLQRHQMRASKFLLHHRGAMTRTSPPSDTNAVLDQIVSTTLPNNTNAILAQDLPHAMMPVSWQNRPFVPLLSQRHSDSRRRTRSLSSIGVGSGSFPTLLDETIDAALCH